MQKVPSVIIIFLFLGTSDAQAQAPCSSPECRQFDFWVGEWRLTYSDTMHAANTITKELNDCVIHEHFSDPSTKLKGESWSVYNPNSKKWQQTWVDNQGSYFALSGQFSDGRMTLYTEPYMRNGVTTQNRMVYYNITKDTLDWSWEATTDGGKTWKVNWLIHYKRK